MQRKLIWQGNSSATVTLPIHWVRERGLANGTEIEMVPSGEHLILGTKHNHHKRKISLEISKSIGSSVRKLLANLYRVGYDEITITFCTPAIGKHIQDAVWKELVGFECIQATENNYIIKDIADIDPESFPVLFKKSFLQLLAFTKEVAYLLQQKDRKRLEQALLQDIEINKLTNLSIRLLHKKMNDRRKIVVFASMLRAIEKSGDCYKDLVCACLQEKRFPSTKALRMLEQLNEILQQVYFLYYTFNLERTLLINEHTRALARALAKEADNDKIYRFCHSILQKIETLTGGPLVLCIEGEETIKKEDWIS